MLIDPFVVQNGLIRVLKKAKVIREIIGITNYGTVEVPVAKINMGKLREFDKLGVKKYLEERMGVYR